MLAQEWRLWGRNAGTALALTWVATSPYRPTESLSARPHQPPAGKRDSFAPEQHRIDEKDPYFRSLSRAWSEGLRRVFSELPPPQL